MLFCIGLSIIYPLSIILSPLVVRWWWGEVQEVRTPQVRIQKKRREGAELLNYGWLSMACLHLLNGHLTWCPWNHHHPASNEIPTESLMHAQDWGVVGGFSPFSPSHRSAPPLPPPPPPPPIFLFISNTNCKWLDPPSPFKVPGSVPALCVIFWPQPSHFLDTSSSIVTDTMWVGLKYFAWCNLFWTPRHCVLVSRCRPFPFFGAGERVWHRAIGRSVLRITRKWGKTTRWISLMNTCPATYIRRQLFFNTPYK